MIQCRHSPWPKPVVAMHSGGLQRTLVMSKHHGVCAHTFGRYYGTILVLYSMIGLDYRLIAVRRGIHFVFCFSHTLYQVHQRPKSEKQCNPQLGVLERPHCGLYSFAEIISLVLTIRGIVIAETIINLFGCLVPFIIGRKTALKNWRCRLNRPLRNESAMRTINVSGSRRI